MAAVELAGENLEAFQGGGVIVQRPRLAQPPLDERAVALGEVVEHVSLFVADTALHRGVDAEDVTDGLSERLGAVEHNEHALLDIQAALDEIGQQHGGDGGVLGRAVPQPERVLDTVALDAQRDDAAAALELDAVEHQHRQTQV
jgi:hypothetical protein